LTLNVLPVGELGRHPEERERGDCGLPHAEIAKGRPKGSGQSLMQLGLASFETLIDAKALNHQPAVPRRVFVVELEVGSEPRGQPLASVRLVAGGPVNPAAEQGRHLILERREHRLFVAEIEIERALRQAGRLHDGAHGRAVVALTFEDPPSRLQQFAPANPLALGQREVVRCPATD
jgi:hypothetical protein